MSDSISVRFDTTALDKALDKIQAKAEQSVRPAAQAGAEHLYFEALLRCPVSDHSHYFYGTSYRKTGTRYYFEPGSLRESIYQAFSKDNSTEKKATYHVAWNHKKVPYGFMVEFGSSRAPAHPFLRPAYDAAKVEALNLAQRTFADRFSGATK